MAKVTVAVSGGFDPLHVGHIRYMREAKEFGDYLVVIINNDNWLKNKKGFSFMNERDRAEIISSLKFVDEVFLTCHCENDPDTSVCRELDLIRPQIFVNGGDRVVENTPEVIFCRDHKIAMVFGAGGSKIRSSSELVRKAKENEGSKTT